MNNQDSTLNEQSIEEFKCHLILNTELLEILNRVLAWDNADDEEKYFVKMEALWILISFSCGSNNVISLML